MYAAELRPRAKPGYVHSLSCDPVKFSQDLGRANLTLASTQNRRLLASKPTSELHPPYHLCEHRFCSQTKTRGDRNCTACFSLANIFNQSTNKSFGAKLQSEVTGSFTQVRNGNLINQSATSCAISILPLLEDCSEQKTFKTNPEKAQLFAESVERNLGIESHLFSESQFDRINKFVEAHSYHFTPLDSLHDNITDTDDDSDLVADVDPDTLIRIVRTELKNGKAPGIDNVYNIILKKAIGTGFYKVLARAFTISLKLGFIPHVWKIAVLCMLIKPDKPPSQTTSYRPISLLSAIMKLFERVIEKCLRKHLEDNGFFSKYQSGFRKSKSTNDHLFRLSQTIMESFNRGEHVIAAFLDVEKAFDNVWHNGLRYKIYHLDLPTKLCRWLSDFLVGRVIQVKIEGFLSPKVYPKAGVPQGSNLSPLLFLIYVNDMPNPNHHQTDKSQFADDAGQWAVSKNIDLAAEYLQRDLDKLARWCAKWRIKLNPEKTKLIIFSKFRFAIRAEPALSLYGDLLSYYPQIKFLGITFDNRMTFTKHFEEILERCNQKFHRLRILVNKKWGPSPETILQIYKQCVRPIFEYGIVSTITVSETVITKIQRVQNSFIRLALRM